ncbi:hypothetical protein BDV27DRAFT_164293 [Aspergillus caelatus]|uniref:Uncharacterized protein n=1 Tax=Aspergillus caelatus TaxID=61420 RepID=A0A5N6ZLK6_9EURO|nr:uncharacterized protein BDV27DRAFT_164293 [Aspergillus caelatus]KAE8357679.1 hypothetical protein BDV27DRAFT_164293 [Aspergillus caelatus]
MRHRLIVAALGALHMQAARSGDLFLEMGNDQMGSDHGSRKEVAKKWVVDLIQITLWELSIFIVATLINDHTVRQ